MSGNSESFSENWDGDDDGEDRGEDYSSDDSEYNSSSRESEDRMPKNKEALDDDDSGIGDEAEEVSVEGIDNDEEMKNMQRGVEKIPPTVIL
jgi:hypothetical protein